MTFLGSAFLLAMPLIAIPVVIHLMKKRRRDVVPWGAMQFLREPSRRGQQLSQMDRWLLLAARIMILVCLIGALTQPLFHGTTSGDPNGVPLQIVMLDDTRSTLANDASKSWVFDTVKAKAIKLIESFPVGTSVQVWASGRPARLIATIEDSSVSRNDAVKAVNRFVPRGGDGQFPDAIRKAVTAASQTSETERPHAGDHWEPDRSLDVWWIGDRSTAGWPSPLTASAMIPGDKHRLHLITVAPEMTQGYQLAIESVRSSRRAVAKNETIELTASIVNHGVSESPSVTGVWKRNGKPFAKSDLSSLPPDGVGLAKTQIAIDRIGNHDLGFELITPERGNTDRLVADNQGSVVVQVIGELPLLVIEAEGEALSRMPRDSDYLAAALGRNLGSWKSTDENSQDAAASWKSLFQCDVRSPQALNKIDWESYPVIVWLGGTYLPDDSLRKIVQRVRQGAGLWITVDADTDASWLNETLLQSGLTNPSSESSEGPIGKLVVHGREDSLQRLHPPDPTDDILAPLSDTERLDLDAIRIRRRINLELPQNAMASRVLLRTFEGDAVSWLSSVGRGRVVLQAIPMNPSWSNFPLSKSYVVWVLQILDHLSQPVAQNFNLSPGQMFRCDVESIDHRYEIRLPNETHQDVFPLPRFPTPRDRFGQQESAFSATVPGVVRFEQTDHPGTYHLIDVDQSDSPATIFTVVGSPKESDVSSDVLPLLTALTDDRRVSLTDGVASIDFGDLVSQIPPDASAKTPGHPVWPALLVGLIAAIALETFMAGYAALRRYGRLSRTPMVGETSTTMDRSSDGPPFTSGIPTPRPAAANEVGT